MDQEMFSSITVLELTTLDIFGKCPNLWPCASPNLALFLNVFFSCFNRPSSSQYEFYSQYFLLSLRCVFEGSFACYFLRVYRIQNFWFFRLYYGFFWVHLPVRTCTSPLVSHWLDTQGMSAVSFGVLLFSGQVAFL